MSMLSKYTLYTVTIYTFHMTMKLSRLMKSLMQWIIIISLGPSLHYVDSSVIQL